MNDLLTFIGMLNKSGYTDVGRDIPPEDMKEKQYQRWISNDGKNIVTLSQGRTGEYGVTVNFYFTLDGAFVEHSGDNCES